jgi:hypothetical protein
MPQPANSLPLFLAALLPAAPLVAEAAFQDRTAELIPVLRDIGSAWCDYNDDGYPDLCTGNGSKIASAGSVVIDNGATIAIKSVRATPRY